MKPHLALAAAAAVALSLLTACSGADAAPTAATDTATASVDAVASDSALRHLDTVELPAEPVRLGHPLGGLSGLDYDPGSDTYLAVSDDRAEHGPARAYLLDIAISADGRFAGPPEFTDLIELVDADGAPFPAKGVDPESIRFSPGGDGFVYTSEGDASALLAPFVRAAAMDGTVTADYALPDHHVPVAAATGEQISGVRNNLAYEGLSFSPAGDAVYVLTENSLIQDGEVATAEHGSDARLTVYDPHTGAPLDEFVYPVEPLSGDHPPVESASGFTVRADRGATELLAVDDDEFYVIERGSVPGKGFEVQIYRARIAGADSVLGAATLPDEVTPMTKEPVFDFAVTGEDPDNVEAITFGPVLADGTRTLVLVSDDNFNPDTQRTRFHLLALP